jgi:hypothetical protein
MRRRVFIGVALAAMALLGAALASGEVRRVGNLQVAFNGGFTPHALPRERPVPVVVSVSGQIMTTDGSHPAPLRWLRLELNRNGRLSTAGLPTCRASTLQSTTSKAALGHCQRALVGRGSFAAELGGDGNAVPTRGRILIFNSTAAGKSSLLLHLYATTPIETTYVLPLRIRRQAKGEFGTVLATRLPNLAGGVGSITQIEFEIGREFTYRGERRGYLSASCAVPAGFSGGPFPFARGTFRFAGGTDLDISLTRDCRVRD